MAIVLTDISVNNATNDFTDGTSSFTDVRHRPGFFAYTSLGLAEDTKALTTSFQNVVSTFNRYQGQLNGLSQSIQDAANSYKQGAVDLNDNLSTLDSVQLVKYDFSGAVNFVYRALM